MEHMEKYDSIVHLFVMYTIKEERKGLRDDFYTKLVETFRINPDQDKLNESAYRIREVERGYAISKLIAIVNEIQENEKLNPEEDFIDLYCSGICANYTKSEKEAHDNVISTAIYPRF